MHFQVSSGHVNCKNAIQQNFLLSVNTIHVYRIIITSTAREVFLSIATQLFFKIVETKTLMTHTM